MTSEMVERVARAILAGHDWTIGAFDGVGLSGSGPTGWDALDPGWQEAYRNMARAAIEAMREPTEEMEDAADDPFHAAVKWSNDWERRCGREPGGFASAAFSKSMYQAMIDKALK